MSASRRFALRIFVLALVFILSLTSCNLPSMMQDTATAVPPTAPPAATTIGTQAAVSPTLPPTSEALKQTLAAILTTPTVPLPPTAVPTAVPPTAKPSPTLTPVPVLQAITAKNAANLTAVRKWGAGTIRKVELSPDETKLLVGSSQGLYLFETATFKTLWKTVTRFAVRDAAFSPDGKTIAAVGDTNGVALYDAASGAALKTLFGHTDWLYAVDFSSTGLLATGGDDKNIIIWDLASGNPLRKISAHTDWISSLRFSGDGKLLVSGSGDMFVKVWNAESGANLKAMAGHQTTIYAVDITPAGDTAVSSSSSGEIFAWDVAKGTRLYSSRPTTTSTYVRIAPDGMRFAVGFSNGDISVASLIDGKEEVRLQGHTDLTRSLQFTKVGKRLVSGSWDGTVRMWDIPARSKTGEITGFSAYVQDMALATNPPLVAAAVGNRVKLLNPTTLEVVKTLVSNDRYLMSAAITRDGKLVATGGTKDVSLWDTASGNEIRRLSGHLKDVDVLAFSPDERWLASGSEDQSVIVWNVSNGQQVVKFTGYPYEIYSLLFSQDGKYLLVAGRVEAIYVYNMTTLKKETEMWIGDDSIYEMLFLPNGNLVGASFDKVWVADSATGKQIKVLTGFAEQVNGLTLSPDGSLLAAGDYDGKVTLFDTATWAQIKVLSEHWGAIWKIAFSTDGKLMYTAGGGDGSVILWNVK